MQCQCKEIALTGGQSATFTEYVTVLKSQQGTIQQRDRTASTASARNITLAPELCTTPVGYTEHSYTTVLHMALAPPTPIQLI